MEDGVWHVYFYSFLPVGGSVDVWGMKCSRYEPGEGGKVPCNGGEPSSFGPTGFYLSGGEGRRRRNPIFMAHRCSIREKGESVRIRLPKPQKEELEGGGTALFIFGVRS